jgi:hypothetical protein
MVLIILANWTTRITDVEGAFLNGNFERKTEKLYGKVPQGFEREYPPWAVLLILQSLYGTIQGALQRFRECCKALNGQGAKLIHAYHISGLIINLLYFYYGSMIV